MYVSQDFRYSIEIRGTASPNPYFPVRDVQPMFRTNTNNYLGLSQLMPRGLKSTSSTVAIGFSFNETAANTFTQESVDLNLDPLNNEVFVVQAINLEAEIPDAVPGTNTQITASLTTTSQTAVSNLGNTNCLATQAHYIRSGAAMTEAGAPFTTGRGEAVPTQLEYLGIIATNDFFLQIRGANNLGAKGLSGKLYGYRARADASIYSALVQGEVLSS